MGSKAARIDQVAARIAANQHGVVSTAQLLAIGLTTSMIRRRVQGGRLHSVYRGVYAVGHTLVSQRGYWMAATLALGDSAVLSHLSAAMLWKLMPAETGFPHVTVPGNGGRSQRSGIVIHRSPTLASRCCSMRNGIPVTSASRTITDLRRSQPLETVRRAIRQAEFLGLPLDSTIERDGTRSGLERAFLDLLRRHGLRAPEVNAKVGRFRVDFHWRAECLAIETDGWAGHRGREQFEDDHSRGLELAKRGIELVRLTERQLTGDQRGVAAFLRKRLSRSGS